MKNKKWLKKLLTYNLVSLMIALFITTIYISFPSLPESFDKTLQDSMFKIRGKIAPTGNIIIIDIDEKSLKQGGQWPWGRDKVAQVLENLTNANIGAIGLDIVFAENDRSSPHKVFKDYNKSTKNIPNYDNIFAKAVASTPTILGYQFELENKEFIQKDDPYIPAIIIEKNKPEKIEYIFEAKGVILNIPEIQNNSYSSGFINNIPDESGMVRTVPLLIRYNEQMYPSLALELIRASLGVQKIFINYSLLGVENISLGDFVIPTDIYGRLTINYRGGKKTFKYLSIIDILNNNFNPKDIEGKIALVGTSATGLLDLRAIPFDATFPGVEVHANAIDNIITQDFLSKPEEMASMDLLLIVIVTFLTVMLVTYSPFWLNPFVMIIMGIAVYIITYISLFHYGLIFNIFLPLLAVLLSILITTFMDYIFEIKKEQLIKKKFASKVSENVMEEILNNSDSHKFHAMQREITVFFSDVRGFTNISEAAPNAKILIEFMNDYMDPMSDILMKNQGTIDKYIGDAIMAYWNAPVVLEEHATFAVNSALEQIYALELLNENIKNNNKYLEINKMCKQNNTEPIRIGIGINTGIATVGEMGSSKRSDYTVIGDAVNIASRVESLCKYYDSKINITNFTKDKINNDNYIFRFLDSVKVKGKKNSIDIWQVLDYDDKSEFSTLCNIDKKDLKEELDQYHFAVELYKMSNFKQALDIFLQLNDIHNKTNNNIYEIYAQRCAHYLIDPPDDFDGIYEHKIKG
ncbi:MAG TPA: adenylate/guanylate cyclase domain-containing protein [Arcobacter sp.]|nr:adenylate/guanylate cyclase domain-containing protein [Arcobacter sp.]